MKPLTVVICAMVLVGCGGDSDDSKKGPELYRELESPAPEVEKLNYASSEELTTLLKNGVRIDSSRLHSARSGQEVNFGSVSDVVEPPQATPEPSDYSDTNVQVLGVDEGDYVKYDGQYLYLHTWPDNTQSQHGVRILETDPLMASASEVGQIPLDSSNYWSDMEHYLLAGEDSADALVTIQSQGIVPFCGVGEAVPFYYYQDSGATHITLHDLEQPDAPAKSWELTVEGLLHHTRKIGDTLYLVTSYLPHIDIPLESRTENGVDLELEANLDALTAQDLLPGYYINDGDKQLLNTSDECLVSANNEPHYGYRSLHHIIAVDLRTHTVADSVCLGTPVETLYSAPDAFYLSTSRYLENWQDSFTVIHKFSLDDGAVNYAATGSVAGHLNGSNASFRMDQHEGLLRVVSSARGAGFDFDHRLWVLQENTDTQKLEVIAMLPNEAQPAPIGKPGEDIYGVRFQGDRAYIVTFMRIDPLYVLDLSEPQMPKILGELELPGFSSYLHPLGDNYLFGFGQDADSNGRILGLKAALFDVSDPVNPSTVSTINLGAGWSDALYDHKALSFLKAGEAGMRITLPVTHLSDITEDSALSTLVDYSRALVLLEIDGMGTPEAQMQLHGLMHTAEGASDDWFSYNALSRGIMHGNTVFYVDEPDVWGAHWETPNIINGPF